MQTDVAVTGLGFRVRVMVRIRGRPGADVEGANVPHSLISRSWVALRKCAVVMHAAIVGSLSSVHCLCRLFYSAVN